MNRPRCWSWIGAIVFSQLAASAVAQDRPAAATAPEAAPPRVEYAIAIHGGAGWEPDKLSKEDRQRHREALTRAIHVGRDILAKGGSALDAVEQTIRVLEDEPLYNAGRGAVFNNGGQHELDAAIMNGRSRQAGGVAGLTTVKNPISLARLVMTETRHVLLFGAGAEKFADEMRDRPVIERVPNEYFSTDVRRREWEAAVAREKLRPAQPTPGKGTVGCVARDKRGDLAAGTSTGGLTNKKWGRVGAVPIVGSGTYADNRTCAVSGTGTGEIFLLHCAAFQLHSLMLFRDQSLAEATRRIIDETLPEDSGGVIAVDAQGRVTMRCNTPGMARASLDSRGELEILIDR